MTDGYYCFLVKHGVGTREIQTTQLGQWAFEGKIDELFSHKIDWSIEGSQPLFAAIAGRQAEVAKRLLAAGSPIDALVYSGAIDYFPEFLSVLPPNPKAIDSEYTKRNFMRLNEAIQAGDVSLVKSLLPENLPINDSVQITSLGPLAPIHYAARNGSPEMIQLIIRAGGNVNLLTPNKKSPLRLLLENPMIDRATRKIGIHLFKARGARIIPSPRGLGDKLKIFCGVLLESDD